MAAGSAENGDSVYSGAVSVGSKAALPIEIHGGADDTNVISLNWIKKIISYEDTISDVINIIDSLPDDTKSEIEKIANFKTTSTSEKSNKKEKNK